MYLTPTDMLEPAEPLTSAKALAERKRLRDELAKVKTSADDAAARDREIKAKVKRIKTEQAQARMEAARKGERITEGRERQQLDALEAEAGEVAAAIDAAKAVRKLIEKELHYLHVQQFEAFANHAEALGEQAAEALEALRPAYEDATRKWNAAQAEYNALVRAHNEGRGGSAPTVRADGSVRTIEDAPPRLSKAPGCPLRPAAEVFGGPSPRPPELEVEAD